MPLETGFVALAMLLLVLVCLLRHMQCLRFIAVANVRCHRLSAADIFAQPMLQLSRFVVGKTTSFALIGLACPPV